MGTIRYEALAALSSQLQTTIPALANRVFAVSREPEENATFPSIGLVPGALTFRRQVSDEVAFDADAGAANSVLEQVGTFDGEVELRVYGKTAPERELYEDQVAHLFLTQTTPGLLVLATAVLTVNALVTTYTAPVSYELLSTEWQDEAVFAKQRYSYIPLTLSMPALVQRGSVYDITTLVLQMTRDLTTAVATVVIDDQVQVNADGTTSPYP